MKALGQFVGRHGDQSPRQQATIIYRWVQQRIHYVAFEDGMNGLVPAAASEVCRTRYGDCKGMSNLLHTLLRARGLDAHLSWVGTRMLPYNYSELPTGFRGQPHDRDAFPAGHRALPRRHFLLMRSVYRVNSRKASRPLWLWIRRLRGEADSR